MRSLTKTEIRELIEEQFPKAQVTVTHLRMEIRLRTGDGVVSTKRKLRKLLDRLVIPYWLTVEVV